MMAEKTHILRLIKTARGQLDGIVRMVEEDRYCMDIAHQLMATEAILNRINRDILSAHLKHCVKTAESEEEREEKIVFSKSEFIEKDSDGVLWNWLIPNAQKNMMEPVLVELDQGIETAGDIPHEGEEFGYVLDGKIAIILGNKHYLCKKGEAFYYSANKPHSILNKGKGKARFLWISTPPNF